ncbi:CZB domain-containing protein [Gemmobacter denitrificans]|uniref:CZB domain-containing protein n=1 Tax=Gemmobacter denitrificans TaxID=3123040 RepID=A0ABU8BRQ0_9RHOB
MNLEDAVKNHAEWRLKFRRAISQKERMDAATIGKDNCCAVGQWLHGEGGTRWGRTPEFMKAMDKHKAFHVQAGRVAGLVNAGKYAEAEAALGNGTPYANASNEVGVAFIALKKAAAL